MKNKHRSVNALPIGHVLCPMDLSPISLNATSEVALSCLVPHDARPLPYPAAVRASAQSTDRSAS
jgi:hypothetical protein